MTGAFLQLRRQRQVEHVHALGARTVYELLTALATETGGDAVLDRLLVEYERLSPAMVCAAGGDRFPPPPVRVAA